MTDYRNSLLSGVPSYQIARLQKLQNRSARLITRSKPTDHITPVLRTLHWLPIEKRIHFKILCFVFKTRVGRAPAYIDELLEEYRPVRALRSQSLCNYVVPNIKSKNGMKSFVYAAPGLWNSLPLTVKTSTSFTEFKRRLKTHMFSGVYDSPPV